jgi:hypothetical protein
MAPPLRFVSTPSDAGEVMRRRLDANMDGRARGHVERAVRSALEAFQVSAETTGGGFDPRSSEVDVLVALVPGRKVEVSVVLPGQPRW